MAFLGDYHTHTVHSHGKGTIEENVLKAISRGLKEIAITDHGFKHMSYNVRRSDFPHIMQEHKVLVDKYPQIKIYLGLETNLQSMKGDIDIEANDLNNLDIIIAGYHKWVKPTVWKDLFNFYWPNFISDVTKISSAKLKVKNTDAFIRAIEKYPIDIISHPQSGMQLDIVELARVACQYGTYLELNGKRICTTENEFYEVLEKTNVEFVANSDAHSVERVGDYTLPLQVINNVKIPYDRIANWDKVPIFRSRINK